MTMTKWLSLNADQKIAAQIEIWRKKRFEKGEEEKEEKLPFVTISREYGAEGPAIAEYVAKSINDAYQPTPHWMVYDKKLVEKIVEDHNLSAKLVESLTEQKRNEIDEVIKGFFSSLPSGVAVFMKTAKTIRFLASHGNVIILGRGGNIITRDMENGISVRVIAPFKWRVEKIMERERLARKEAENLVKKIDNERDQFVKSYLLKDVSDPNFYDIIINHSSLSTDEAGQLIIETMKIKSLI